MTGKLTNHRVLVTGAAGFLGKQFAAALIQEGADVLGIDRQPLPSRLNVGQGLVKTCRVVQGELRTHLSDAETFLRSVPTERRGVFHMAGLADAQKCFQHPDLAFDSHVRSTVEVLEMCRKIGGATFVYPSTGLVYGNAIGDPATEDHPVCTASIYSSMKFAAERLVFAYATTYRFPAVIGRLGNVYGPGVSPKTVIGKILEHVKKTETIRVTDETPVRDFIFSEDVVEAVIRLLPVLSDNSAAVVNISTGKGTSIGEAVAEASRLFKVPHGNPAQKNKLDADVQRLILSNRKLKRLTGWVPPTSLSEGLKRCVNLSGTGIYTDAAG